MNKQVLDILINKKILPFEFNLCNKEFNSIIPKKFSINDDNYQILHKIKNIKIIEMGVKFNKYIKLPEELEILIMGIHFNQPIELPKNLKHIIFGLKFNQNITLPIDLLSIEFDNRFIPNIKLPENIKSIKFPYRHLQDNIIYIPQKLINTIISFKAQYTQHTDNEDYYNIKRDNDYYIDNELYEHIIFVEEYPYIKYIERTYKNYKELSNSSNLKQVSINDIIMDVNNIIKNIDKNIKCEEEYQQNITIGIDYNIKCNFRVFNIFREPNVNIKYL
jgi:hypothetical protein